MDDDQPTQRASADDRETVRTPKNEVVFNRYELLGELGKGGMGVVWLALDRELNTKVALKFLREEMTSEPDALKELKGEVIINRDLSHPHIVKTFNFETNGRTSAISMEYVNGTNLHKWKAQRPARFCEVEEIRQWMLQLCDAMHYAHQQKVVHRDLKPANLMLNERGELKVGDFGIGRTVADTINRVTKNAAGTPPYMSPQQTMGEKAVPHDDVYSIGATIYDLLTGEPPFFRGAIREQTLAKVPSSMTERRKEAGRTGQPIPPEWEKAVAACLAKDAAARPPTAKTLRDMLEGKPVVIADGAGAGEARRSRAKWIVAAAVLALVGAGGAAYWRFGGARPPPAAPPVKPAEAPSAQAGVSTPETAAATVDSRPVALTPAQPVARSPAQPVLPASEPAVQSANNTGKNPVENLVEAGRVSREEGRMLDGALQGPDPYERALATRLAVERSLSPAEWRAYSSLVPPADELTGRLRPMLAAGLIRENEFGWLRAAAAGQKGELERMLARQMLDEKTLAPDQWRTQTELYPPEKRDPLMEKVRPLLASGALTLAEGQWLRSALAGDKNDAPKALASRLVDEKNLTPGQWRARTEFSYALKEGAALDPAQLPPAIDLALNDSTNVRLLRVDPGAFVRGSPKEELGRRPNEQLPERVTIAKPFYIGIHEVTQVQFMAILPRSPSFWRGNPTWPIDQVDWQTVAGPNGYIARLNRVFATKYGGVVVADLPSEEEWEYACRAGTQTSFNNGKNISNIDSDGGLDPLANYNRAAGGSPRPVGSYQPNAWGLYDMHGNIAEWCQNRYQRGGSWQAKAANCRAAWRTQVSSDGSPSNQVGFRLVLRYKSPVGSENPIADRIR